MTWESDLQALHQEANGMLEVVVVDQSMVPGFLRAAMLGDVQAARLMVQVCDTISGMRAAPADERPLCLCCPRTLGDDGRFSLAFARPAREGARRSVAMAICKECAPDPATARVKVMEGLREVWPELRQVEEQHHAPGHA